MSLNHGQRLALNLDAHLVLDAGAGTGKTKTIVERVIEHYLAPVQRASLLLPRPARPGRLAGGMIIDGEAERVDLNEWSGLLPTEVVVLTFTNAAAEELKHRLRKALSALRAGSTSGDAEDRADSRIPVQGLPDQFRMLLEDAPIGTIDSFFSRLISSYRPLLSERVSMEQISIAEKITLETLAVNTAWRLSSNPSRYEIAIDAGIPQEMVESFFDARSRLSQTLGSTATCRKVVRGLLTRSVFLEGVVNVLGDDSREIPEAALREAFTAWLDLDRVIEVLERLQEPIQCWFDMMRTAGMTAKIDSDTRFAALAEYLNLPTPSSTWEALVRIFHLNRIICSHNGMTNGGGAAVFKNNAKVLPNGYLPAGRAPKWERGHKTAPSISDELNVISERANLIWSDPEHVFERQMAFIVGNLDTTRPAQMLSTHPIRAPRIDLPTPYSSNGLPKVQRFDLEQETRMLNDLCVVQKATAEILSKLKSDRGLHDFEDTAESVGDLLLARCPKVCRIKLYSPQVVSALDKIDHEQPWSDHHIDAALELSRQAISNPNEFGLSSVHDAERAHADLLSRVDILQKIRRRYMAMIIDEAQDVNPRQWKLLSRLWGKRQRVAGDPPDENLEWEPTICYVGDLKQSIYLFRQAQVATFHRYAEHLRRINEYEFDTVRVFQGKNALRTDEWSRDPRALHDTFVRASMMSAGHRKALVPEVRFDVTDKLLPLPLGEIYNRRAGHVRLAINYRTSKGLLKVMNRWWSDVFDPRHQTFSRADWYAKHQQLHACDGRSAEQGILEWLLPVGPTTVSKVPEDLVTPIDPFRHGKPDRKRLEATLIVERIRALIQGSDCMIGTASGSHSHVEEGNPVDPGDIMVLLPSRKLRDPIVAGLRAHGIPVQADKEGELLSRQVIDPLMGLVQFLARPDHRHHAAWVARSVLVGMNDSMMDDYLRNAPRGSNLISRLIAQTSSEDQKAMFHQWENCARSGRILEALELTADYSDLLVAHPTANDRADVASFVAMVNDARLEVGGDSVMLADRLMRVKAQGDGAEARTLTSAGSVRLMTIHKSKGLQSKVVILADAFGQSLTKATHENQDRLIVSPNIFGVHPKPWPDASEDPISPVWDLSTLLNQSQRHAEARRLLYVAATRAEERLIISGSPRGAAWIDGEGIRLEIVQGATPSFGPMLIESMRQSAHRENIQSPWLNGEEDAGIPAITPKKYTLTIDPLSVQHDLQIGEKDGIGMRIYHSPDCFHDRSQPKTVIQTISEIEEVLSTLDEAESVSLPLPKEYDVLTSDLTPAGLDVAQSCMRRHWFQRHIGLQGEVVRLAKNLESESGLPPPNVFGSIVHRLVEIGAPSPARDSSTIPLPVDWTADSPSRWDGDELEAVLPGIFDELLTSSADRDLTADAVKHMIQVLRDSPLGQFLIQEEGKWGSLDGVRTELPFGFEMTVKGSPIEIESWSPWGSRAHLTSEHAQGRFSGLVDLVVAYSDDASSRILPIDLKTEDAYLLWDPPESIEGTLLEVPDNGDLTDAEKEILTKHRHQLVLYHLALVRLEEVRKKAGLIPRIVERPAVWVGVSGRLVQMDESLFEQTLLDLDHLIHELVSIDHGGYANPSAFPRLPLKHAETCWSCPFSRGSLPICGPEDI
tara:strand:- start:1594 stop:6495 length:4902 start_codon:yes stop_codon:yes gene_type:complete